MKFKNYVNPYTKENKIYSKKDILAMSVAEAFKKTKEILGQNKTIGIPSVNELRVSGNVIWINEYTREDGTKVCGHWRSKPETGGCVPQSDGKPDRVFFPDSGKNSRKMEISGGEVVDALKSVIGGGIEKIKEFGELLAKIFDKIDPEVLKSLPDNLKELYVNVADKIGSGTLTGAASDTLGKLEDASEFVLKGGVEIVDLPNAGELIGRIADKINLPEVNADVVKKVLTAASEVGKADKTIDLSDKYLEIRSSDLSDIKLKHSVKISKFKNYLININNAQNINYKDAMQCMNIGLIGPENIENNTNFRVLSQNDVSDLSKRMSYDIPENIKTVEYSADSTLAKSVKNSATFRNAVKAWVSTPAEYRQDKIFLTLNDNENLARSILHATIFNPQVSNGYFTGYLYDLYDFRLQILESLYKTAVNDAAYVLQEFKQLKNYNILIPIKIKL